MPIYLLWGFRWPRQLIRVHVIVQKIDDAAPEWLMSPSSSVAILESFEDLYPAQYAALPHLRLVEQYDPLDEQCKGQPHAYIAARWQRIDLSANVDDTISQAATLEEQRALGELKDALGCKKEKCGWHIVYCGDEIREFDNYEEDSESSETDEATSDNKKPPHSLLHASNLSAPTQVPAFSSALGEDGIPTPQPNTGIPHSAAVSSNDSAVVSTNDPRLASAKSRENLTTNTSNSGSIHVLRDSSQRPADRSRAIDATQSTRIKDEPENFEKQTPEKKSSSFFSRHSLRKFFSTSTLRRVKSSKGLVSKHEAGMEMNRELAQPPLPIRSN